MEFILLLIEEFPNTWVTFLYLKIHYLTSPRYLLWQNLFSSSKRSNKFPPMKNHFSTRMSEIQKLTYTMRRIHLRYHWMLSKKVSHNWLKQARLPRKGSQAAYVRRHDAWRCTVSVFRLGSCAPLSVRVLGAVTKKIARGRSSGRRNW